jgi:hypothetical protein
MANRKKLTTMTQRIAMTVVVIATFTGCAGTKDWITERISSSPSDAGILGAQNADNYLQELGRLASGDPAIQAEIFADASSVALLTPGPSANLRLGLVLATPGHAGSDPDKAQTLLREVLTETLLLTPSEIYLATINLNSVEQQITAAADSRRLRGAQTQKQAIDVRLAEAEAENARIRTELKEAEQKLEAITSIERSIREQE